MERKDTVTLKSCTEVLHLHLDSPKHLILKLKYCTPPITVTFSNLSLIIRLADIT